MASLFECEVRFFIKDIKRFERRLGQLRSKLLYPYEFNDYYFRPTKATWDPLEKNLRIREWKTPPNPTTIYFVKNEIVSIGNTSFKRSLYPQGKVALFSGDLDLCKALLCDLGFKFWFVLKKEKARLWEIPQYGFKTVAEYIKGLGWTGELEFEGENLSKAKIEIEKALNSLNIPRNLVTFKPISVIFAEKHRLL